MGPDTKKLAIALCAVAAVSFATQASAKPKHRRHVAPRATIETRVSPPAYHDDRYANIQPQPAAEARSGRQSRAAARSRAQAGSQGLTSVVSGTSSLVEEARRYLGGNPTGRRSLWCGAFMDMVLKRTGHRGGGNLARAYAHYGTKVSHPQVGAIAVMARKGGGHVGVVSGIDSSGNPIIISGNHNNRVAESVYPKGRIITYVLPN
jgi:uncharacterized protein (TIGR02594 family)